MTAQTVRVSDRGNVISIVPLILGYQPKDGDLVLLGLDERGRVIMGMRLAALMSTRSPAISYATF
jgi:hypothetical protein